MRNLIVLCFLSIGIINAPCSAQDRSIDEFKDYVNEKTGGQISQQQLEEFASRVDKNSDGTISESEFEDRMSIFSDIMSENGNREGSEPADEPEPTTENPEQKTEKVSTVTIAPLTKHDDATVLLITADELAESWIPFAKWKTQNGKHTKIMTVSQIDNDFDADSIQEKIRLCVQDHIQNSNTQWLILGGDCLPGGKGLVPGGHTTVHSAERKGIPTDIVYLSPTNWDSDGDGIYGEFDDDQEAITYPDGSVGLGRIPVRTPEDVKAFTAKVIAYESSYPTTEFARNMIYTCTDQPAYPKVRNSWDSYVSKVWEGDMGRFFSKETPWDEEDKPGSYALSPKNVVNLFNEKTTSKMHIHGHGHLPAWVLERSQFTGKHVQDLKNSGAYPLITTVSCNTGEYDSRQDPSIVEHLLRVPEAGSVAVVAPVRTGKPHFADRSDFALMVSEGKLDGTTMTMTRYWTHGLGKGYSTGHAMMMAKKDMIDDARDAACYHLCICELNLLGDPTLDMRAETPREPKIEVAAKQVKEMFEVTVKTDAPGSTVCLWNGEDMYEVVTADDQGVAKSTIPSDPQKVMYTVSGKNLNSVTQEGLTK